jgi:ferredoxin
VLSLWDESGKFSPKYDTNNVRTIECDTILVCIGQSVNWTLLDGTEGLVKDARGNIPCDAESGRTANPKVYIAGDAAYGPKLAIHAIASGKKIARQVALDLGHAVPLKSDTVSTHTPCEQYYREAGYERLGRQAPPAHTVAERLRSIQSPVERTFSLDDARSQAHRCLSCDVNTVFDSSLCILCGGCVDVCPEDCLKIIPVTKLAQTPEIAALVRELGDEAENTSSIIKDEDRCIRCALCAERCPTNAVTMERFSFREVYRHG